MNTDAQELQSPPSPSTVKDILDLADPSHIAIIAPDGPVLTYVDLKRQVDSLADKLNSIGIGQEDRVAIILPNRETLRPIQTQLTTMSPSGRWTLCSLR